MEWPKNNCRFGAFYGGVLRVRDEFQFIFRLFNAVFLLFIYNFDVWYPEKKRDEIALKQNRIYGPIIQTAMYL